MHRSHLTSFERYFLVWKIIHFIYMNLLKGDESTRITIRVYHIFDVQQKEIDT